MTDDDLRNALPHAQPRKQAVYQDFLDRRAEAKAKTDGFREREVIAVEAQAKGLPIQRWTLIIGALGVLAAVVFGVLGRDTEGIGVGAIIRSPTDMHSMLLE